MADDQAARTYVDEVVARLRGISRANGYQCDIGSVVDDEPSPMLDTESTGLQLYAYLDGVELPAEPALRRTHWKTGLIVVAKATSELDDGFATRLALLNDVDRALNDRTGWPAGSTPPEFQEAKFLNRATGLQWVGVALRYSVHVARPRA